MPTKKMATRVQAGDRVLAYPFTPADGDGGQMMWVIIGSSLRGHGEQFEAVEAVRRTGSHTIELTFANGLVGLTTSNCKLTVAEGD